MLPRSLYARIALLLMALFFAVGALMILATQHMPEIEHLADLATALIAGTAAFSLGAALVVFKILTARLRDLSAAIDAFRVGGADAPLRLAGANPDGDEIDRLGSAFQEMSQRIVEQFRQLADMDANRRDLLANVSHDLRTPLTSMQGYLEMLLIHEGTLSPEERRSYLQVATRQCERLAKLVNDLFELTKLEARETRPDAEDFPLQELARDVVQKFDLAARKRGIRIACECAPDTPPARAEIGLIERLLENLIDNALRHTPADGEVRVLIGPARAQVEIRVEDTGEGIPPEQIAGVFDRFYQVDRGEAGAAGGAGLGLAIARRIVELHDGDIRVDSTPGRGTRFSVRLPAASPDPAIIG